MHSLTGVPRRPVVLIILDGFGVNPSRLNNGVAEAKTPNLDTYFSRYPHTTLNASGDAVGLPDGLMGNSEVGHFTLGAGDVIRQDIVRISDSVKSGDFFENAAFLKAIEKSKKNNRPIHLIGLVSDGGVHSSLYHLSALIKLCKEYGVQPLLHAVTDGRDTPPRSAMHYLPEIEAQLHESGGAIASITGRFFAMDRDNRWDRTEKAWRAYVHGKAHEAVSAETAVHSAYAAGDTDEFIQPIRLPSFTPIEADDQVIFFNFRKDRPRQMVAALGDVGFKGFDRGNAALAEVTCMMPYDRNSNMAYAYEPEKPTTTLGKVISTLGLAQFHCAETEKYAHVTYFFNGGRQSPYAGETQVLIPSPGVNTYDQKPSMSAKEVADAVVGAISKGRYSFIVVNFANGDMVGHTAKRDAVLEAVETLDREAARVLEAANNAGYSAIVTADHGNCEEMIDPFTGEPHTQHTTYPVPCMIMDEDNWQLSSSAGLSNVAPTVLQLMGLTPAAGMTSSILLRKLPGTRPRERQDQKHLRIV
jgi:2,3-bisphosphoglycerate-independent phosphoglycerate mutase